MRPVVIGLTGPIGCGKSTVARMLGDRGAVVIDADEVARAVTAPAEPGHADVLAAFGDAIRDPDGALDRAALARIVFADPAELRRLEAIVHPRVREVILDRIVGARRLGAPGVVVEAIKLVEGGLAAMCDEVWLVDCSPADQWARLVGRGMADDDARRRIAAQADIRGRLGGAAHRRLDTSRPFADVGSDVGALWRLIALGGRDGGPPDAATPTA